MTQNEVMLLLVAIFLTFWSLGEGAETQRIGNLRTIDHDVSGIVYILDSNKIKIENFNYDGTGPDAFFYVGSGSRPIEGGARIQYPPGSNAILGRYSGEDVILTLPSNMKMSEVRWLSVWCRKFGVNFGDVYFPRIQEEEDDGHGHGHDDDETEEDHGNEEEDSSAIAASIPFFLILISSTLLLVFK